MPNNILEKAADTLDTLLQKLCYILTYMWYILRHKININLF